MSGQGYGGQNPNSFAAFNPGGTGQGLMADGYPGGPGQPTYAPSTRNPNQLNMTGINYGATPEQAPGRFRAMMARAPQFGMAPPQNQGPQQFNPQAYAKAQFGGGQNNPFAPPIGGFPGQPPGYNGAAVRLGDAVEGGNVAAIREDHIVIAGKGGNRSVYLLDRTVRSNRRH